MDYRRLDLNLLLVLDVLFVELSVGATARRLGVSQPTVSASLGKLRVFFGDELFVRSQGGMRPTGRAESLRGPIRRLVSTLQDEILLAPTFLPQTSERTFTVATSDIGELVFLPRILNALVLGAPRVQIRSVSMKPDELQVAMANGQVDLALGYFPDFTGGAFFEQTLFEHPFTCIVRSGHPAALKELTLERFLAMDHAVVSQEGRSQEIFENRMEELGLERRIMLRSQHFMSVPLLVANTDLITTVPRAVGRAYARMADVVLLAPPLEIPTVSLKQFWHKRVHSDPGVSWFRKLVATLFLNADPSDDENSPIFGTTGNPPTARRLSVD